MYEQYFDLTGRPFGSAPNAGCWFPAEAIEQARLMLTQSISLAGGVGLVVGPPGTGKSLLLERLAADFGTAFQVVTLASTRLCSRRALLQNILFELRRPYRGLEEGELRLDLIEHLRTVQDGARCVLLLVDEAHAIGLYGPHGQGLAAADGLGACWAGTGTAGTTAQTSAATPSPTIADRPNAEIGFMSFIVPLTPHHWRSRRPAEIRYGREFRRSN